MEKIFHLPDTPGYDIQGMLSRQDREQLCHVPAEILADVILSMHTQADMKASEDKLLTDMAAESGQFLKELYQEHNKALEEIAALKSENLQLKKSQEEFSWHTPHPGGRSRTYTPEERAEVVRLHKSGVPYRTIAKTKGMGLSTVWRIIKADS